MHKSITSSEEETTFLGEHLGRLLAGGDVVLLTGDLGAGKTRFAKGVARGLGVAAEVTSPTFNLMVEYPARDGLVLRHFDLYRLERAEQLDDLDYFGLLEDDTAVSLVEWGDRFADALPESYLLIGLSLVSDAPEQRELVFSAQGARFEQLLVELLAEQEHCDV
jgi:tRNA threonylcarbamoyladenosine biosynthesis protein TsaE